MQPGSYCPVAVKRGHGRGCLHGKAFVGAAQSRVSSLSSCWSLAAGRHSTEQCRGLAFDLQAAGREAGHNLGFLKLQSPPPSDILPPTDDTYSFLDSPLTGQCSFKMGSPDLSPPESAQLLSVCHRAAIDNMEASLAGSLLSSLSGSELLLVLTGLSLVSSHMPVGSEDNLRGPPSGAFHLGFWFFETGFLCVALAVLELTL